MTMDNEQQPLFRQIALLIEDAIAEGVLAEGARAPSTNELARFHSVNPATAGKGIALLVESGVLEKRRGVGMFVAAGAGERIRDRRRAGLAANYVAPLVDEALRLGYSLSGLQELVARVAQSRGM